MSELAESNPVGPDRRWPGRLWRLALWLVLTLVVIGLRAPTVLDSGPEVGVLAADSILVQTAEDLRLVSGSATEEDLSGPGPIVLYVLAAGEVLFSQLASPASPIGGQHIAMAAFDAAWIVALFVVLTRVTGERRTAGLTAVAIVGAIGLIDPDLIGGTATPLQVELPFVVALLAAAAELARPGSARTIAGVAAAVVLSHHGQFMVAAAAVLAAGYWCRRWNVPYRSAAERRSDGEHGDARSRWAVAAALPIGLLVALPSAIETVREWPGPVFGFARSINGSSPAGIGDVAGSMLESVGPIGVLALGAGVAAATVGWRSKRLPRAVERFVGASAITGGAAACAALVVALWFVDDLDRAEAPFAYLAAMPAVAAGVAVLAMSPLAAGNRGVATARLGAVAGAMAIAVVGIAGGPGYDDLLEVPEVDLLADALEAAGSDGLVIDLHLSAQGEVLPVMTGAFAELARRDVDGVCVDRGWQLALSRGVRCTGEADGPRLVASTQDQVVLRATPLLTAADVGFFEQPRLAAGDRLSFAPEGDDDPTLALGRGWSSAGPDFDFFWQVEPRAEVWLVIDPLVDTVIVELDGFVPFAGYELPVEILVDGVPAANATVDVDRRRQSVAVAIPPRTPDDGAVLIEFLTPAGRRPVDFDINDDVRPLGLALYAVSAE